MARLQLIQPSNAEGEVRHERTARKARAADVQERHPVRRGGAPVPKRLYSYRIARAKSESGQGCAEIGDAPQHLAAHYSEFRTRHPAVTPSTRRPPLSERAVPVQTKARAR